MFLGLILASKLFENVMQVISHLVFDSDGLFSYGKICALELFAVLPVRLIFTVLSIS